MNTFYPTKEYVISTLFTLLLSLTSIAQVGIGNTSPNANALLDIGTDSSTAGLRLPRVALTGTANFAPLSAHVQGMTVYNTAVISDVIEGYYYNDGTKWVLIASEDWKLLGNAGTSQTQNFVGTTDNVGLTFRTNNLQRFRINTNNQLLALENGSAAAPSYSWGNDTSMGFYKSGNRQMDMVINGTSFYNANRVGSSNFEWTFNPGGVDLNLRVETDSEANALFVDGLNDNIGFGTNSPNLSSQLEMTAINKGLLINRVILSATNNASPITSPATGLLIYNTATASTGSTAVTPGFYYWDGSKWVAMGGTNGNDWSLLGNAGTSVGTNFIGTTDSQNLIFKTNDSENMRIITDGRVAINDTSPYVGDRFTVTGASNDYAINGYASGAGGVGIYAESSGFDAIIGVGSRFGVLGLGGTAGVYGTVSNATGFGMIANNDNATGVGLLASGSNAPLSYLANTGATINGSMAIAGYSTSASGTGISGTGNGSTTSRTLTNGSGLAGSGNTGAYAVSTAASNGTGIIGVGGLTSAITTNLSGSGIAGSGLSLGVFGYAGNGDDVAANYGNAGGEFVLDGDNDPTTNSTNAESNRARAILAGYNNVSATDTGGGTWSARNSYFGGYFSGGNENGGNQTYSYTALRYRIGSNGTSGGSTTDFKVIGPGSNSTLINDSDGSPRIMFSPEAPEILFQDFGIGQLVNGQVRINIDPILKGSLYIDNEHPLKVYVTLEGECNGIYVTNKSADGFTVKELQGGTSNVAFSWQIVANRADTKDSNGRIVSKHVGVRLPIGPGPIGSELKKLETIELNAKELKDDYKDINSIKKTDTSKNESVISNMKK